MTLRSSDKRQQSWVAKPWQRRIGAALAPIFPKIIASLIRDHGTSFRNLWAKVRAHSIHIAVVLMSYFDRSTEALTSTGNVSLIDELISKIGRASCRER